MSHNARRRIGLVLAACLVAACGSDDSTVAGEDDGLNRTLDVLRSVDVAGGCELMTERVLFENYGAYGERGRERCVRQARPQDETADVTIVDESRDRAVVEVDLANERAFVALVRDGSQWLIDGIGTSRSQLTETVPLKSPDGVDAAAVERFLERSPVGPSNERVTCVALGDDKSGPWGCEVDERGEAPSYRHLVEVGAGGEVSAHGGGRGPGISGCCIEVRASE